MSIDKMLRNLKKYLQMLKRRGKHSSEGWIDLTENETVLPVTYLKCKWKIED